VVLYALCVDKSDVDTWQELLSTNRAIIKHFSSLVATFERDPKKYKSSLETCSMLDVDQVRVLNELANERIIVESACERC